MALVVKYQAVVVLVLSSNPNGDVYFKPVLALGSVL